MSHHDAILVACLGTELEAAEASLPLPSPPRLPSLLANHGRVLRTPPSMAAVNAATVAPMKRAS